MTFSSTPSSRNSTHRGGNRLRKRHLMISTSNILTTQPLISIGEISYTSTTRPSLSNFPVIVASRSTAHRLLLNTASPLSNIPLQRMSGLKRFPETQTSFSRMAHPEAT